MNKDLECLNINKNVYDMVLDAENKLQDIFKEVDKIEEYFSLKVLKTFKEENVQESDFSKSTGYGYGDVGRDKIERIFAKVLGGEAGLVRGQFISGSHALTVALFALLRPSDTLLSITGLPYDTLHEVIGIKKNDSSLESFNIKYKQIDLLDNDFDYAKIKEVLENEKIKVIEIQRSKV